MSTDLQLQREVERRRTFAIISHPDAGKTTLTEKLLLFGNCIEVAGAVRGRKSQRGATSDWMELEKQRGISVTSTVLTFEYDDHQVNLLDTPGHHDFSEDTYRTLMAADCAVMVIDLAKGVETQTEKLYRVCALRQIPVITFVNKVDRPGPDLWETLAEVEERFGIETVPQTWPIGTGRDFCGIVDIPQQKVHHFAERDSGRRIESTVYDLAEAQQVAGIPAAQLKHALEEVELLESAGVPFDRQKFLAGQQSPVYFGSALTNFGVERFLQGFLSLCPQPTNRESDVGEIPAGRPQFSGFVFKIQANLDPRHRDRIAFLRVCSGKFERDMEVLHARTGKKLRLRQAHRVFGAERETMDDAYPGDIIGLVNPGEFRLGDTICQGSPIHFEALPQFSPEHFAVLNCHNADRRKQFQRGLSQLIEEGAIQMFHDTAAARREPILGAVGQLQFDVVRFRLESEYDTATEIQWLPYTLARWLEGDEEAVRNIRLPYLARLAHDQFGHPAILFQSEWDAQTTERNNPDLRFLAVRRGGFELAQG